MLKDASHRRHRIPRGIRIRRGAWFEFDSDKHCKFDSDKKWAFAEAGRDGGYATTGHGGKEAKGPVISAVMTHPHGVARPRRFGAGGMPVGMQLLGNYFREARLLNAAHRFQQATDWHARKPEGF